MAITFVDIPGGTTYGDSLHYAAFADSPVKLTSNKGAEGNLLFKVEILNGSLVSLITCYFPPTANSGGTATLEFQIGSLVKNLIPEPEPIAADATYRSNATAGYLYHKLKVTEIYDVLGVPTPDTPSTVPTGGDFFIAHNIAHEGDPGMDLGIYPQAFLTNDTQGTFPIASHKQLSVWVDPTLTGSVGAKVVIQSPYGNSTQYVRDADGDIPITIPSHGRIVIPINEQTLSITNKATGLIVSIFPLTAPPPLPIGIMIKPPVSNPPPGGGVLIETASDHGYIAGNVITIANTGAETFYEGTYEVLNVPTSKTFYIAATYDALEATDENYESRLIYIDDVGETAPYFVQYKVKQSGCYFQVVYANRKGGFDVVDFISEDSVSVYATRERFKLGEVKRSFGTVAAARRELSTGWLDVNDFELMQGLIASSRHWRIDTGGDPVNVLMLTDSAKLTERRDVVSVQVMIEEQDIRTNE